MLPDGQVAICFVRAQVCRTFAMRPSEVGNGEPRDQPVRCPSTRPPFAPIEEATCGHNRGGHAVISQALCLVSGVLSANSVWIAWATFPVALGGHQSPTSHRTACRPIQRHCERRSRGPQMRAAPSPGRACGWTLAQSRRGRGGPTRDPIAVRLERHPMAFRRDDERSTSHRDAG